MVRKGDAVQKPRQSKKPDVDLLFGFAFWNLDFYWNLEFGTSTVASSFPLLFSFGL
jgi:hypothetical protein